MVRNVFFTSSSFLVPVGLAPFSDDRLKTRCKNHPTFLSSYPLDDNVLKGRFDKNRPAGLKMSLIPHSRWTPSFVEIDLRGTGQLWSRTNTRIPASQSW